MATPDPAPSPADEVFRRWLSTRAHAEQRQAARLVTDAERERAIVTSQVPGLDDLVAAQLVDVVVRLRELELKKAPSIAESVDWARTLIALQIDDLDEATVARTLGVVLKHASDQQRAIKELKLTR